MKRLILFRHAKSSWDDPGLSDHRRPLAPRGMRAAPAVARWLGERALLPDHVLCSDAVRTRQTWALVEEAWAEHGGGPRADVVIDPDLYLASPRGILALVAATPPEVDALMVVGHNPGMHDLAATLAVPGGTPAHARLARKFPTAAVAVLDFDAEDWSELGPGQGRLVAFVRPKDLPEGADR